MERSTRLIVEGNWDKVKGSVKETWGDLTDDDLARVAGNYDRLVGMLKERTGRSEREIEREIEQALVRA